MRHTHTLLILATVFTVFVLTPAYGEGDTEQEAHEAPELPYAVRKAEERFGEDITKAQEEYSEAIKDAADDYVKVLQREKDRATRAANLELALYLKKQIEEAQAVVEAEQVMPPTEGGDSEASELDVPTTAEEYAQVAGKEFSIDGAKELNVLFNADPRRRYQVVVHPTDTWKGNAQGEACGPLEGLRLMPGNMVLHVQIGENESTPVTQGMIFGGVRGRVVMFANDPYKLDNVGSVRVKIRLAEPAR